MVEAGVAALILLVAVGGFTSAILAGKRLARTNDETALASEAVWEMAETLQDTDFGAIFTTYAAAPGFEVVGLTPVEGDDDGLVGSISFPSVTKGNKVELREDVDVEALGMPRDLNGDGAQDSDDHSGDYVVLPVIVRVQWAGASGNRIIERSLFLVD